jgi:hypothetical protein
MISVSYLSIGLADLDLGDKVLAALRNKYGQGESVEDETRDPPTFLLGNESAQLSGGRSRKSPVWLGRRIYRQAFVGCHHVVMPQLKGCRL